MSETKYASIVFLQEHEAIEAFDILEEMGESACIDYLKQWDFGEYPETSSESHAGLGDITFTEGNYTLSYHPYQLYIGLEIALIESEYCQEWRI